MPQIGGPQHYCSAPGCLAPPPTSDKVFCEAHSVELYRELNQRVRAIRGECREFYIGRSHWPERRLLEHFVVADRNQLAVLYWAGDHAEIREVEGMLIEHSVGDLKVQNKRTVTEREAWAGMWNCVYVSFRWKNGANRKVLPPPEKVECLSTRRRLHPDRGGLVPGLRLLSAGVNVREAQYMVDAWYAASGRTWKRPER